MDRLSQPGSQNPLLLQDHSSTAGTTQYRATLSPNERDVFATENKNVKVYDSLDNTVLVGFDNFGNSVYQVKQEREIPVSLELVERKLSLFREWPPSSPSKLISREAEHRFIMTCQVHGPKEGLGYAFLRDSTDQMKNNEAYKK